MLCQYFSTGPLVDIISHKDDQRWINHLNAYK